MGGMHVCVSVKQHVLSFGVLLRLLAPPPSSSPPLSCLVAMYSAAAKHQHYLLVGHNPIPLSHSLLQEATVQPRYVYESHVAGITSLAVSGTSLASGGADECIKVYDLAKEKEIGTMYQQQGTITCLEFFEGCVCSLSSPSLHVCVSLSHSLALSLLFVPYTCLLFAHVSSLSCTHTHAHTHSPPPSPLLLSYQAREATHAERL
jgi:WD40 repeat protein